MKVVVGRGGEGTGKKGRQGYLQDGAARLLLKGGFRESGSAPLPSGLHEPITPKHVTLGRLVQTRHLRRCRLLAQSGGAAPSPCPGVVTSIHQPWCS